MEVEGTEGKLFNLHPKIISFTGAGFFPIMGNMKTSDKVFLS